MATDFNPNVHSIIVGQDGKPVPQVYDPDANGGDGGFVVLTDAMQDFSSVLAGIKDTDGIKKITDAVDVADREARKLGEVQLSGSIVEEEVVIDAETIAPDSSGETFSINKSEYEYLIFAINADKDWRLEVSSYFSTGIGSSSATYPNIQSSQSAKSISSLPQIAIYTGYRANVDINNSLEAMKMSIIPNTIKVRFGNLDTEEQMTATLKVIGIKGGIR